MSLLQPVAPPGEHRRVRMGSSVRRGIPRILASSWVLGILLAALTWRVSFVPPSMGLDPSWWAGLYMAAQRGIHFGSQLIFNEGPLGFLGIPWLWYGGLAVVAFLYQALLFISLCVSLVFVLRRILHPALALLVALFVLTFAQAMDLPVALAALWCLAALSADAPRFAEPLVIFGGALVGVTETLTEFRPGPVILLMCAITLIGQRRWRRDLLLFVAGVLVAGAALWFGAGQSLGSLPDFLGNSLQIVLGYSQALGAQGVSRLYLVAELVIVALLLAAAATATAETRRARAAGAVVIGVAAFSIYKEAVVRADAGHTAIFLGTAALLLVAVTYRNRRWLILGGLAGISAVGIVANHDYGLPASRYSPINSVRLARDQVRLLFDSHKRDGLALFSAAVMTQQYGLSPPMLRLLGSNTVAIEPWEQAAAWTYRLNWDPLPVLQNYVAYTPALDRLDADALRSPSGPQRILRENGSLVDAQRRASTVDGRYVGWDPPEAKLAMLCNYVPLMTDSRWQVLGKVPDRCGRQQLIASVHARAGSPVSVPPPRAGAFVYARIRGAGVSGLESIRSFLYRARNRYAIVNGTLSYRLIPGTAADGLLMRASGGIDYPAPFALSPAATTIALTGTSGDLVFDFYSMPVASATGRPRANPASRSR